MPVLAATATANQSPMSRTVAVVRPAVKAENWKQQLHP